MLIVLLYFLFFTSLAYLLASGTRFKTVVEYAPSQRVAKHLSKKDGREGTIYKGMLRQFSSQHIPILFILSNKVYYDKNVDPVYMEFLESIAKPIENLPSAEIQLERREAERVG